MGHLICGSRGTPYVDQRVPHLWIKGVHHLWIKGSLICGSWGPSSVDHGVHLLWIKGHLCPLRHSSPQAFFPSGIHPFRHPSSQTTGLGWHRGLLCSNLFNFLLGGSQEDWFYIPTELYLYYTECFSVLRSICKKWPCFVNCDSGLCAGVNDTCHVYQICCCLRK